MRIEYELSESNFLEAQKVHSGWSSRPLPVFGVLLMLAAISTVARDQRNMVNAAAALLVGGALTLGPRLLFSYSYRRDKRLHDHFVVTFSDEGVEVAASTGNSTYAWKAFTRWRESKNLFILYQGPACLNIFPKSGFASGEVNAFRTFVQQKLGQGEAMARKGLSPTAWVFVVVVTVAFVLMLITIRNAVRQSSPNAKPEATKSTN